MASVPHRKIQRDKEPDDVTALSYLQVLKCNLSKAALDKAFDGEGLFHRKDCPDIKDSFVSAQELFKFHAWRIDNFALVEFLFVYGAGSHRATS